MEVALLIQRSNDSWMEKVEEYKERQKGLDEQILGFVPA
jgi:hypothetical protein